MSNVLKAVILLFILVDCQLASPALKEIIIQLSNKELNKIPCGDTMVPEVHFNAEGVKESEVFCKAAKYLEKVPDCWPFDITGLRVNLMFCASLVNKADQTENCTVDEDREIQLLDFLKLLRKFSQKVFRKK